MLRLFRKQPKYVVKGTAELFEASKHQGLSAENISHKEWNKRKKLAVKANKVSVQTTHTQKDTANKASQIQHHYSPFFDLQNAKKLESRLQEDANNSKRAKR